MSESNALQQAIRELNRMATNLKVYDKLLTAGNVAATHVAIRIDGDAIQTVLKTVNSELSPCEAVIWHGRGHQSKSRCIRLGPHDQHHVKEFYWHGDEGMSSPFDDSPEEQ